METKLRRLQRILGAFEELFDEQSRLLFSGSHAEALEVQARCVPLVDEIARLAQEPSVARAIDAHTQARAERILQKHAEQLARMVEAKALIQQQLYTLVSTQSRAARFRSAYRGENDQPAYAQSA